KHAFLMENLGIDRGDAAVGADTKSHRHRVRGPGEARAHRFGLERISQGARVLDRRLQGHAIDHPREDEKALVGLHVGAGRDGDGKGAGLDRDRLRKGIDAGRGAAQDEAGRAKESWFGAPPKAITRLAPKARKGTSGRMPTPNGPIPTGTVATTMLVT